VARETSNKIYYRKVFDNAKRCLREAKEKMHPSAKHVMRLKDPSSNEVVEVMDIEHAIRWCISFHLGEWSQGTWRMMRASYRMLLEKLKTKNRINDEVFNELVELMSTSKGLSRSERAGNKKTSSRRKKHLRPEDIEKIEAFLADNPRSWGQALVIWLWAAIGTGLRPNEWQTARWEKRDDARLVLSSDNFKHNKVRSYAPRREIDITDLPPHIIQSIKQQMVIVNGDEGMVKSGMAESHYKGCSALLLALNKKLWPRRKANINLYTGRHQFSSNAKADPEVSDVQRAALMGHKTTKTSRERYGRTSSGSKGLTPVVGDDAVLNLIKNPEFKGAPQQNVTPGQSNKK
jgi:integrase